MTEEQKEKTRETIPSLIWFFHKLGITDADYEKAGPVFCFYLTSYWLENINE